MKLQELASPKPSKQISKVFESYFGNRISFDQITGRHARAMLTRVQGILKEHRATTDRHFSERNPDYLKLVMMEQALVSRIQEQMAAQQQAGQPQAGAQQMSPQQQSAMVAGQQQQKKRELQDAIKQKQQEIAQLQKAMSNPLAMAESRLRRAMKRLNESEVQQAQVVLAAQDMVDKMQGMLEDVTELQFKELPALVDSIKNQVGIDQAQQFNTDASAALSGLVQNLQGAKQQLDAALGVVTGQAPSPTSAGADLGADLGADIGADIGADVGADLGDEGNALDDLDAAADVAGKEPMGNKAALGRGRR
jgi:hypothetical protein